MFPPDVHVMSALVTRIWVCRNRYRVTHARSTLHGISAHGVHYTIVREKVEFDEYVYRRNDVTHQLRCTTIMSALAHRSMFC